MKSSRLAFLLSAVAACSGEVQQPSHPPSAPLETVRLTSTAIAATLDAAGVAEPFQRSTLSTKLMGTVISIGVQAGDQVARGQLLARIDATDLDAKRAQIAAGLSDAEAMVADAQRQLARMTKLAAEKAAPRIMLENAETGYARAQAALDAARAQRAELDAVNRYAEVRAPFAGQLVKRFVDVGAFAAPGAPLLTVQDSSRLRISAAVPPAIARVLTRGAQLDVTIEGVAARGVIEGIVPVPQAALYTVNVVVDNADGRYLADSAATVHVPQGERVGFLVPSRALVREGDLVGVRVAGDVGPELRWVRVGRTVGDAVEVLSGVKEGDALVFAKADGR